MTTPIKYPFTLTRSSQCPAGMVESETTFEGFATYHEDEDTQFSEWEVEVYVTGFTQYQNGRVVSSVTGIKSDKWTVSNLEAFEADCVDRACYEHTFKMAKKAA